MENEIVDELAKNIKLNLLQKLKNIDKQNEENWQNNVFNLLIDELADVKAQLLKTELDLKQVEGITLSKINKI